MIYCNTWFKSENSEKPIVVCWMAERLGESIATIIKCTTIIFSRVCDQNQDVSVCNANENYVTQSDLQAFPRIRNILVICEYEHTSTVNLLLLMVVICLVFSVLLGHYEKLCAVLNYLVLLLLLVV